MKKNLTIEQKKKYVIDDYNDIVQDILKNFLMINLTKSILISFYKV